jgi:CDP-glycerol glycerophosphotransferase
MNKNLFENKSYITDVSLYPDMQELLLISDVLITDYSTIIYDMAIMHKVILLYAPDLEDYKNNRGLKPIYFKLPTCINQSNKELLEYIGSFDVSKYQHELDDFLRTIKIFDDGNASERVVDKINSVINY